MSEAWWRPLWEIGAPLLLTAFSFLFFAVAALSSHGVAAVVFFLTAVLASTLGVRNLRAAHDARR
jgi:hypothetical protein